MAERTWWMAVVSAAAAIAVWALPAAPATAAPEPPVTMGCSLPESDAESLVILHDYYPGYWWDHSDLTIAAQIHPTAKPELVAAVYEAIDIWSATLQECFGGAITLTRVSARQRPIADIVVNYVPTAGGVSFGGYALCGDHTCPNIIVTSDLPPSLDRPDYDPARVRDVTLHEVGHALGLGHATNLLESTDLMGYGWMVQNTAPVLSDCDLDALTHVFEWVFTGSDPYEPGPGPYDCSLD